MPLTTCWCRCSKIAFSQLEKKPKYKHNKTALVKLYWNPAYLCEINADSMGEDNTYSDSQFSSSNVYRLVGDF